MAGPGTHRPAMVLLGEGRVWLTASASRIDKFHITIAKEDGSFDCTCEGWRTHKKCWHVTELFEDGYGTDGPTDFQVSL